MLATYNLYGRSDAWTATQTGARPTSARPARSTSAATAHPRPRARRGAGRSCSSTALLVNANLWRKVVPRLDGFTRVALDLPLGSHLEAMPKDADLTPPALADLIADAIAALGLTA